MIYVRKPPNRVPRAFIEAARAEMKVVLPLFRQARGRTPSFKFRAYRNKELLQVLQELFHNKCAYCEAQYAVTGYVEVEHYRPKSLYYWLAAEWSNLLPSCKRCNNGKLSKFPLVDPRRQARRKGQERGETPLLLNPSDPAPTRRPEKHLTFDTKDGAIRAVEARGQPSAIGTKSIEVYRLSRTALSQSRKAWSRRVMYQIEYCRLASGLGKGRAREFAYQGLKEILAADQPYRALTLLMLRKSGMRGRGGKSSR